MHVYSYTIYDLCKNDIGGVAKIHSLSICLKRYLCISLNTHTKLIASYTFEICEPTQSTRIYM